ncbi:MAG: hypothetical protein ACRD4F_02925, partial [Candidatus Angelobacter sp.]
PSTCTSNNQKETMPQGIVSFIQTAGPTATDMEIQYIRFAAPCSNPQEAPRSCREKPIHEPAEICCSFGRPQVPSSGVGLSSRLFDGYRVAAPIAGGSSSGHSLVGQVDH